VGLSVYKVRLHVNKVGLGGSTGYSDWTRLGEVFLG
jgi:hypothetical protein